MIEIVKAGAERIDDLEPLWHELVLHQGRCCRCWVRCASARTPGSAAAGTTPSCWPSPVRSRCSPYAPGPSSATPWSTPPRVTANEGAIRFYRRHGFEPMFTELIVRIQEPVKETDTPGCDRSAAPDRHPRDRR